MAIEEPAYAWYEEQFEGEWVRSEQDAWVLLRSPELELTSLDDIEQIDIEVDHLSLDASFSLHWNGKAVFDRLALLNLRFEFRAFEHRIGNTFSMPAHQVSDMDFSGSSDQEVPPRFLFLRIPQQGVAIKGVKIYRKGTHRSPSLRPISYQSIGGQIQKAIVTTSPATWSYRTRFSGKVPVELTLGLFLEGAQRADFQIRLRSERDSESRELMRGTLHPTPAWQYFRVVLPEVQGLATLIFSAEHLDGNPKIYWGNPMLTVGPPPETPNVIVYVMDALRASQLSLYGYHMQTDPNIKAIGDKGLVFEQAYATATWTKPSVASLLTSLYPQTHGVGAYSFSDSMPETVKTLPEYFQQAGYRTAHFSANPLSASLSNLHQGFDVTFTPNAFAPPSESATGKKVRADKLNETIIPWITQHQKDRFFAYIHTMDTHTPYEAPDPPQYLLGTDTLKDHYNREIFANDRALGRLVHHLETLGLLENTLIIITSDHGESFQEHGKRGHGVSVYQEEIHIPLIFFHKNRFAPAKVSRLANLVDLMPTLLSYCGIEYDPDYLQGQNLLTPESDRSIVSTKFVYPMDSAFHLADYQENYAIIKGHWKLIVNQNNSEDPVLELYSLVEDPDERNNLVQERQALSEEMLEELMRFLEGQQQRRSQFLETHFNLPGRNPAKTDQPSLSPEDEALLRTLGYIK